MPTIHQAVLIGASATTVYDAVTSKEGLSAWWTPHATADPEQGSIARFPFGDGYFKEMKITVLKPLEEVHWICIAGADEWIGTYISFMLYTGSKHTLLKAYPEIRGQAEQLEQDAPATLLIFRHTDWKKDSLMFAECSYTWGQFLRSLKLYCETGTGRPWPYQHRTNQ
ncbi:SRPBCC domain-containing protein [Niabella sp.]|uniref:SRPBCC family protein n=1 Tax=Niabella sp. TaxID=1962976 RepID=UPI00260A75DD|nr:SRPBCC domain-containing protein [Niabella sp.]